MWKCSYIVENTLLEYKRKYGYNNNRTCEIKCITKFLDKIKNETKNITLTCYNIIGGINKIMQSTKGMCKFIRIIELKIKIQGRINNNIIKIYLRSENIPILWKFFFVRIAIKRDNGLKSVNQQCHERHFIIYKWNLIISIFLIKKQYVDDFLYE